MSLSWEIRLHPEQSAWRARGAGRCSGSPPALGHTGCPASKQLGVWGAALYTLKELGGRKLRVGQGWINKAKAGRLGAQEVSVLLSPGDDGGDDIQQTCCWDTWQGVSPRERER